MQTQQTLLKEIDKFLRSRAWGGMSESYFGQNACGNSKLMERLRAGRPIQMQTAEKILTFMEDWRARAEAESASAARASRGEKHRPVRRTAA